MPPISCLCHASQIDKVTEELLAEAPFCFEHGQWQSHHYRNQHLQRRKGLTTNGSHLPIRGPVAYETPGSKVEDRGCQKKVRDRMLGILFSQSFDIVGSGHRHAGGSNYGCQIALGFKKALSIL